MTQPAPQPGQYPSAVPVPAAGKVRPSIDALFASVIDQIPSIIRDEVRLSEAKLRIFAPKSGKGIGLPVAVAVFVLHLLDWAFHAVEVALKLVVPTWAASLIIVDILLLIVLILALVNVSSLRNAQAHRPDPVASVAATKKTVEKGLGK